MLSSNNKIKQLFDYPDQVTFVATTRAILIIYMTLIYDGRYHDPPINLVFHFVPFILYYDKNVDVFRLGSASRRI